MSNHSFCVMVSYHMVHGMCAGCSKVICFGVLCYHMAGSHGMAATQAEDEECAFTCQIPAASMYMLVHVQAPYTTTTCAPVELI
jgi:hypothetical protein